MLAEAQLLDASPTGRLTWLDLPSQVRGWVETALEAPVEGGTPSPYGFSRTVAERVQTTSGRSAFVKAAPWRWLPTSARLLQQEAAVLTRLGGSPHLPRVLAFHADRDWVTLLLGDVPGHHPGEPWTLDGFREVALACSAVQQGPGRSGRLPDVRDLLAPGMDGWRRLAMEPPSGLDPGVAEHLPELVALERRFADAVAGDSALHGDLRADNVLVGSQGCVLLDWPWACRGAAWYDLAVLLPIVVMDTGSDPEALLQVLAEIGIPVPDQERLLVVVASAAGYYLDRSRRGPGDELRNPRDHQRARAREAWELVLRLAGWT